MEYVRNARAADLDNGAAVELAVPVAARTGFKRICQANSAVGYGKVIYMLVPGNYVFGMPEFADGIKNAVILRVAANLLVFDPEGIGISFVPDAFPVAFGNVGLVFRVLHRGGIGIVERIDRNMQKHRAFLAAAGCTCGDLSAIPFKLFGYQLGIGCSVAVGHPVVTVDKYKRFDRHAVFGYVDAVIAASERFIPAFEKAKRLACKNRFGFSCFCMCC